MNALKVAVLADFLEERWPSMDLVADMLVDHLRREHAGRVEPVLVRPTLRRRAARVLRNGRAHALDRVANRLWDYPRLAARLRGSFDVFHVVDHSYGQLVHALPPDRTVVTCHDTDTFRSVLEPHAEARSAPFRAMARHILGGLARAAHVACDSGATREALVARAGIRAERTSVVHNGAHPSCTPVRDRDAEAAVLQMLGPPGGAAELLHVGSTIPRKRIDVLLRIVATVKAAQVPVRLIRVGGALTPDQRRLSASLGIDHLVVVLPSLGPATLAAVYRRCALLLLPSEREGFGLPVVEAMACGTPAVASGIAALREVGGEAAAYCAVGDVAGWSTTVRDLLDERRARPDEWRRRRESAMARAACFSWSAYARDVASIYTRVAGRPPAC